MAALFRMLTLVAFVLMPFTMAPAEAHAMPAAMTEGHCGEHPDAPAAPATDMAQCLLMCAALPAAEPVVISSPAELPAPREAAFPKPIHGIILEIATPPPRVA
jgi:hypothetical protein